MKVAIAILAFLIGLCAAASSASAQTTRPAPAAFAQLVQKLADTLVVNDVTALTESLAPDATIDGFGETQLAPEKVMIAVSGSMLVSFRAYNQTPSCLASDLAQDFEKAKQVPESVRREMIPDSEAIVRANVTAAQWVNQTLDPNRREVVGVITFCPHPEPTSVNKRPTPIHPVFILIKGEMDSGKPRIKQIVFGNPLEQRN